MNKNTAGAVLMLVLAATGLGTGNAFAVGMVVATCALTVITEEARDYVNLRWGYDRAMQVSFVPAVASWLTAAAAILVLII